MKTTLIHNVKKSLELIPMDPGGQMIKDLSERKIQIRRTEIATVAYIVARYEIPQKIR